MSSFIENPSTMRFRLSVLCYAFLSSSVLLVPLQAQAQTSKQLAKDIDRLESQVKALQRQVFDGDTQYFSRDEGAGTQINPSSPQSAAAQMVRLDALEETVRSLTGQIEEIRFKQRQDAARIDAFIEQTNYRLNALDGAGGPQEPASDAGSVASSAGSPAAQSFNQAFKSPAGAADANTGSGAQMGEELPEPAAEAKVISPEPTALPADPKTRFDEAFQLARRDRFDDAEQAFLMFIADYPEHELASNAQYWLGRVYTAKRETSQAAEAFFEGYRRYPDGNKAPENLLAFASTLRMMEKPVEACTALNLLRSKIAEDKYPNVSERVLQGIDSENSVLACT